MNPCEQKDTINEMSKAIMSIAVSIGKIEESIKAINTLANERNARIDEHISSGPKWRIATIGIIFAGIIQVISFAMVWGKLTERVDNIERSVIKHVEQTTRTVSIDTRMP